MRLSAASFAGLTGVYLTRLAGCACGPPWLLVYARHWSHGALLDVQLAGYQCFSTSSVNLWRSGQWNACYFALQVEALCQWNVNEKFSFSSWCPWPKEQSSCPHNEACSWRNNILSYQIMWFKERNCLLTPVTGKTSLVLLIVKIVCLSCCYMELVFMQCYRCISW